LQIHEQNGKPVNLLRNYIIDPIYGRDIRAAGHGILYLPFDV